MSSLLLRRYRNNQENHIKIDIRDFPGGTGDKIHLPTQSNSISGPGRLHMPQGNETCEPQLLGPCAATVEACGSRACILQQERPHNEKSMHCNEEQPPLAAARQTPLAATKTQRSQKKNLFSNQLDVITLRKPLINNYFLYVPVTGLNSYGQSE